MDRILDSVGNGYRLCILGDLNRWVGDRTRAGITGAFRVTGENDNGRRLVEFREERGYVQDVRAVRGKGRGLSNHYVALCKIRLVGAWIKRREVVAVARRIVSEKMREHKYRDRYARSLEGKRVE